jgi:hypothetical protein
MRHLKITTLEKGWHDKDEIPLHAAFQLLTDFVEQEQPEKRIDWNHSKTHRQVWKEIKGLYTWWKDIRQNRKDPFDDKRIKVPPLRTRKVPGKDLTEVVEPNRRTYADYYRAMKEDLRLTQKWHQEDQRNLHRLIEIRGHLWT